MKRIKTIAVLIVVVLTAMICQACSVGDSNAAQPVTITLWHVYGAQTDSPLNDLIEVFNNTVGKDQGIQVEVTMVSNNNNIHEDILAAARGVPGASQLPDIFVAYPKTVQALPDEEILVDYRDYFSEDELAAFIPSFIQDGTVNNRLVSLPVAKSTELMFINKTAFDRFSQDTGIQMSQLETWEGLYAAAEAYAEWTDAQTPEIPNDAKALFVHDFHFNYFQVGVESLGESFFDGEALAFGPEFERIWLPYAEAALSGGVWLQGGYATEPLRTGESIVSVASSASVLYFSNEVIYADNTSETVELVVRPCPVFEGGGELVMQRGAGMCTVRSTPEREAAAVTFLKWLTEPEVNTRFAVSTGYMPVTQRAFEEYLPQEIESLTEQKYIELYRAYLQTQEQYTFYTAPQLKTYLETETDFEENVRRQLLIGREEWLNADTEDPEQLTQAALRNYQQFRDIM